MCLAWWLVLGVLFAAATLLLARRLFSSLPRVHDVVLQAAAPSCIEQHAFTRGQYESLMAEHHQQQARLLPRFTQQGWFLTSLPAALHAGLVRAFERKRAASPQRMEIDPAMVEFQEEAARPIMTDIAHTREEKARAYPNSPSGMPGVPAITSAALRTKRSPCAADRAVAMSRT
jgi:hypothetical protein